MQLSENLKVDSAFNFDMVLDFKEEVTLEPEPVESDSQEELVKDEFIMCWTTKGSRKQNEDHFDYILGDQYILAAVFDGHGGSSVALYLKNHLLAAIQEHQYFETNPAQAIKESFARIQMEVTTLCEAECGSTAIVVLCTKQEVYVASLGDGLCYGFPDLQLSDPPIFQNNQKQQNDLVSPKISKALLNQVHNLDSEEERSRVRGHGGSIFKVRNSYRICGELNVSRSFGDLKYKKWMLAHPSIKRYPNTFRSIVLATDGLSKILPKVQMSSEIQNIVVETPFVKDNSTFVLLKNPFCSA